MSKTIKTFLIAAAVAAALTGCQSKGSEKTHGEQFPDESELTPPQHFARAHAAAGARAEANLYACHFDDTSLNSLGRVKLDAILRDGRSLNPLTIHMLREGEEDASYVLRTEAVSAYLMDQGLTEWQIKFLEDYNQDSYSPAATGLARLNRTGSGDVGAPSSGTAAPAAP